MNKAIGSGGITTDGLVFSIDAFNLKSYDNISSTTSVYNLYSGNTHSVFSLDNGVGFDGRNFTFDGIDDNIVVGDIGSFSSFSLDLWFNSSSITDYKNIIDFNGGDIGLRIEQYSSPGFYAPYVNLGGPNGYARIVIELYYGFGFGFGADCPGNIIENEWVNLILTYQNGGFAVPLSAAWLFDGVYMLRVADSTYIHYTMNITGNVASTWNNWISTAGGTLPTIIYESTGTYSQQYIVSNAVYNPVGNITYLIPAADPISPGETMSGGGFIDNTYFAFNSIRLGDGVSDFRWDSVYNEFFLVYPSLTMSLVSGTYTQTYVVDSVIHSTPYTYLYDSANIGATLMPNTYSIFTVVLPKFGIDIPISYDRIVGTSVSGNITNVYINGDKVINQWISPGSFPGYISNMRIGDGYDYSSRRFQGKIPITSIYNRAISGEEAATNYEELKWRFNI